MLSVLGMVLAAQAGGEAQVEPEVAVVPAEVVSGAAIIVPATAA
jgi:hypothetical protein